MSDPAEAEKEIRRLQLESEFHQQKARENYDYAEEQACRAHRAEVKLGKIKQIIATQEGAST